MMPRISIIVPVYNVSKYLMDCYSSLNKQVLTDLEIILVDDGSTDGSGEMCEMISQKDSRVVVIHKENGGLSSARNEGLKYAKAEYIAFLDSDDWVEPEMYSELYSAIVKHDADVCICSFKMYDRTGAYVEHPKLSSNKYDFLSDDALIENYVKPLQFCNVGKKQKKGFYLPYVTNKLYRKRLFSNLSFRSEREFGGEDLLFSIEQLPLLKTIAFVNKPLYHWRYNESSLTKKYSQGLLEKHVKLVSRIETIYRGFPFPFRREWLVAYLCQILLGDIAKEIHPLNDAHLMDRLRYIGRYCHSFRVFKNGTNFSRADGYSCKFLLQQYLLVNGFSTLLYSLAWLKVKLYKW